MMALHSAQSVHTVHSVQCIESKMMAAQSVPLAPRNDGHQNDTTLHLLHVVGTLSNKNKRGDGRQNDSTYASQTAINSLSWQTLG